MRPEPVATNSPALAGPTVGALIELLATLVERVDDGILQKRQLLEALATLIEADAWVWTLTRTERPGDPACLPVVVLRLDGNLSDLQKTLLVQAQQSPHRKVFADALFQQVWQHGRVTCRRSDLLSDADWLASSFYHEFCTATGLNEFLMAIRRIGTSDVSTAVFYRKTGRDAFTPEQLKAIELALDHIPWLHQHGNVESVADQVLQLTPREREVLHHLVAGSGRKQIARKLGISEHTVGGYQKRIYHLYNVTSRGELQAKFFDGQARR